jgi:hypothetical protein
MRRAFRLVPGTGYQVSGTGYLAPGTWYPAPGTRYLFGCGPNLKGVCLT